MTMTREADQLYTQLTGQPKFPVFPEGEGKFFLKVVDAQLTFASGPEDKATEVVLHQGGRDRVASESTTLRPPPPKRRSPRASEIRNPHRARKRRCAETSKTFDGARRTTS